MHFLISDIYEWRRTTIIQQQTRAAESRETEAHQQIENRGIEHPRRRHPESGHPDNNLEHTYHPHNVLRKYSNDVKIKNNN